MGSGVDDQVRALHTRAETALRNGKPRDYVIRLFEQLIALAPDSNETSRLARRQLAELLLESAPWQSLLHLRRVIQLSPADDVAHALSGLGHALLGNFQSAVAAYRRALATTPNNPWYLHNLGHLLDVALSRPRDALPYLERAHRLEPTQGEVSASLAHCLGRVGRAPEGVLLIKPLVEKRTPMPELRTLLRWLEAGGELDPQKTPSTTPMRRPRSNETTAAAARERTNAVLASLLDNAGVDDAMAARVMKLCADYERAGGDGAGRPDVLAASLVYALRVIDGEPATQAEHAERFGVSRSAVQTRYAAVRTRLALKIDDPRYRASKPSRPRRPRS